MARSRPLLRTVHELFVALLNATLILIVLATFGAGYLINAVGDAAERGTERLTGAALGALEIEEGEIAAGLESLAGEVASLRESLADRPDGAPDPVALERVETRLAAIEDALERLRTPEISVSPETFAAARDEVNAFLNELVGLRETEIRIEP